MINSHGFEKEMSDARAAVGPPAVASDDHARGARRADVTLMVYGDYECPYTRKAYRIIQRLERSFGDRLRFVFRHFPLTRIHPHAQAAAETAEAAGDQGAFWEMHDLLFRRQQALDHENLRRYTEELGLDVERVTRELSQRAHAGRVNRDVESGLAAGVEGTPTLFVNGVVHADSYEPGVLRPVLEAAASSDGQEGL